MLAAFDRHYLVKDVIAYVHFAYAHRVIKSRFKEVGAFQTRLPVY